MISMPYFVFIELIGPVMEMLGYLFIVISLVVGGIYVEFAYLLFLLMVVYGSLYSMAAVLLEEWSLRKYPKVSDIAKLFVFSLTESFWYRPLTVIWRCHGLLDVIRNKRAGETCSEKEFHNEKWLLIGGIILVMAVTASPFLIWQLKKPTDLNMLVIDKTVPDQTFREHQGLMWMLNQAKVRKDGKPYEISKDYAGFYPNGDKTYSIKSLPKQTLQI